MRLHRASNARRAEVWPEPVEAPVDGGRWLPVVELLSAVRSEAGADGVARLLEILGPRRAGELVSELLDEVAPR